MTKRKILFIIAAITLLSAIAISVAVGGTGVSREDELAVELEQKSFDELREDIESPEKIQDGHIDILRFGIGEKAFGIKQQCN